MNKSMGSIYQLHRPYMFDYLLFEHDVIVFPIEPMEKSPFANKQ